MNRIEKAKEAELLMIKASPLEDERKTALIIRGAQPDDHDAIWQILEPIIRAGETYPLPRDMSRSDALAYWVAPARKSFVAQKGDTIMGTYYMRPNYSGGGKHIANCGYMVASNAQGQGIARAMCAHSLHTAPQFGFIGMQFNFVVSTNTRAVALWKAMGFETLASLPKVFEHPTHGKVDALVMFKALD